MAPEAKTTKNSKLPKLPENYFEPVGKGGWPLISTWITYGLSFLASNNNDNQCSIHGGEVEVETWYRISMEIEDKANQ
jgi:hypothetical protein